jgi:hypothetical protein
MRADYPTRARRSLGCREASPVWYFGTMVTRAVQTLVGISREFAARAD